MTMTGRPQPVFRTADAGHVAAADPRQLECFIAVAEELNINRAAARLNMTQPPLTRRIQRLEHDVGAELFCRTPGGMELTEAGRVLLERAYRIVTLTAHAVERARKASAGEVGHLRVGYYDSAILEGIPVILAEFRHLHPEVTVSFELVPGRAQPDYLRDHLLHVGFGRDYAPSPDIACRTVALEELYIAAREPADFAAGRPAAVADLRDRPLVVYPATRPGFADDVIRMCRDAGFSPAIAIEADDVVACLAYVAVTEAIAVVPASATKTGPHGVTFIPLADALPAKLDCIWLAANPSPALAQLTGFLSARMHGPAGSRDYPGQPATSALMQSGYGTVRL
jgi:LysR family transcriptional regulator, benzoate and cis,cis-muconate-responsive activator of ben and cat genes